MSTSQFVRRVLIVAAVVVAIALTWLLRDILISALFAVVIAIGMTIPARWLQEKGMRRGWALAISITGITLGAILLVVLAVPTVAVQIGNLFVSLEKAASDLATAYGQAGEGNSPLAALFPQLEGTDILAAIEQAITGEESISRVQGWLFGGLLVPALQGVGALLAVFINVALLWLIAIWFAVDPETHIHASTYLVPRERQPRLLELWRILGETLANWLRAQSISIGITVTLVYLILGLLLDLPNALIVALFAGIATFIPNIGAFLPLIPIAVFGLASDTPQRLLIWIPVYLTIQLVESNFITPAVVKSELEIPAGAMMIFQLAAALLFGALGLLLAVPLFAVIIVLVRELYSYDALGLRPADAADAASAAELPAPAPPAKALKARRRSA